MFKHHFLPALRFLCPLVMCVCLCGVGFAQSSIVGTVTDPAGGVIGSAAIRVINESTSQDRAAVTNDQGYFVVPALSPATYTLKVEVSGFSSYTRTGIIVGTDQTVTSNVSVSLTAVTESVTVTGSEVQVDTTTSTLSEVVDQRRIVELPLNGRNAASLALVTAGTVLAPASADEGNSKTFPGAVTISANGARQNQTSFRLDGGTNNDIYTNVNQPFPFPDALEEFSVQTSNYSSRYGGSAGGVVNVVTKSGTNDFHGDAFEFVRNAVFNARNFFADTRDQLKRNQYGGTFGGPLSIPGLYRGRDRTFFFGGYQGTRIRNNVNGLTGFVPTQANLNGDFSALLNANDPNNPLKKTAYLKDPSSPLACSASTGGPGCFPGNRIPVSRFDPAAVALSKLLPSATGNGNVIYSQPLSQNFDEFVVRGDHTIGGRDHLLVRYYYDRFQNQPYLDPKNYLNNTGSTVIAFHSATIGETHTFGSSAVNDFRISYGREFSVRAPAAGSVNAADLGINIWQPAGPKILEGLNVTGYFNIGQTDPATFGRNQYSANDAFSITKGKHTLSFGGDVLDGQILLRNQFHQPGAFTFTADNNNDALASFLLGGLRTFIQGNGEFKDNRLLTYGLFAEDNYHVTRRLTLNLGIRYDPFFPWHETKGRTQVFDSDAYNAGRTSQVYVNAPPGLLYPGDAGVPEYGLRANLKNVAPRVGFALDLDGNGRSSLRGGAGMFFDSIQNGIYNNRFVDVTPFSVQVNLTAPRGTLSNPYLGITNPFPVPLTPPKTIAFPAPVQIVSYDPSHGGVYQTPVVYGYNLTFEHQFPQDLLFRLAYVGSRANHLLETIEKSPAIYRGSLASPDSRRYYPQYGSIGQATQDINSNYNSLQATLNRKFSHGFTLLANYTWSHSIDDLPFGQSVTTVGLGNAGGTSLASPILWFQPGRHAFDRGPSEFDRTHRFVASFVYQAPTLRQVNTIARYAIGGWQVSGIINAQTGSPITIVAGRDVSGSALGSDRAVYNGMGAYGPGACGNTVHCVDYISPSAFSLPAQGSIGSTTKGQFRGPGQLVFDAGLSKDFPIYTERVRLQFKAEFFNVLNRTNYFNPGLALTDTTGNGIIAKGVSISGTAPGSIRAASDPRIGQLALKLLF